MHCSKNWVSQTYLYCSKVNLKCIFCTALLALCLCSCGNENITVKTELTDGETVAKVELSEGELFFKDPVSFYNELSDEEIKKSEPKLSDYKRDLPVYDCYDIEGAKIVDKDEAMRLLNIYPENWVIPESCGSTAQEVDFLEPYFYLNEEGKYVFANFTMFRYSFRADTEGPFINLQISPAPIKWSQSSTWEYPMPEIRSLLTEYGKPNSNIGDMPLAVRYGKSVYGNPGDTYYRACFEAGNAAYEVLAQGVTQREFIDLLISIYASPRPETRNFFDVILPNAGD